MSRLHALFLAPLLAIASIPSPTTAVEVSLSAPTLDVLSGLAPGAHADVAGFPTGPDSNDAVRFERVDIYAPGARIIEIGLRGERELPRSTRIHLLGRGADGVRMVVSFAPGFGELVGTGSGPQGSFVLRGERHGNSLTIHALDADDALSPGIVPRFLPGDDALAAGANPLPNPLELALAGASAPRGGVPRGAVVAIDTDNELMNLRFGNDAGAAANWIADLFATMNLMYIDDLNVRLLQGTTFLRTAPDPYGPMNSPADQAGLQEFGSYWESNYASVTRAFAALLSGKSPSGNSASGIAWLNAYCNEQTFGGSYSVNQVFTNPGIPVDLSARLVGHELGHNFGAAHTHCTEAATGIHPVGINTIDQCFSGESGCYSGATSCPSSGPGNPLGTIMSYCNINGCGQNVLQFHPTQVTTLSALIALNTPSCLLPDAERIFADGFE
jgi:hypothetical protein